MELKLLYERYGEMQIRAEILNNQIMEVKRQIAESLNKPPAVQPKEEVKE